MPLGFALLCVYRSVALEPVRRPMPKSYLVPLLALLAGVALVWWLLRGAGGGGALERDFRQLQTRQPTVYGPAETEIDFDLLDRARPLDLVEMDLDFPEELEALEGRRVRIVGFMAPWDSLTDMSRCLLVPSYVGCSFCSPPSLTQVLYVEQAPRAGGAYPFIEEPSDITGTLRLPDPASGSDGHRQGFVFVLEDAFVAPYADTDAPERVPGHWQVEDPVAHAQQIADEGLPPVALDELVGEIAELRGLEPAEPIEFEPVAPERFAALLREDLERRFPPESRETRAAAFALLGMEARGGGNWLEAIVAMALRQRIALADSEGRRIRHLAQASFEDPYVRLEIVKEIGAALVRQHFAEARRDGSGDLGDLEGDEPHRAIEAVRQGDAQLVAYRYARRHAFSTGSAPPLGLLPDLARLPAATVPLELWYWLPSESGPFFADSRTGASRPLSLLDALYERPPRSTLEIFRPRWYDDPGIWRRDPVEPGFADLLLGTEPDLTGVLGFGGLVPWLGTHYPPDVAKRLAGGWAGDRYALWHLSGDEGDVLLLEIRWQDADAEERFREAIPPAPLQHLEGRDAKPGGVLPATRLALAASEAGLERLVAALKADREGSE